MFVKKYWEFGLSTHNGTIKEVNEDTVFLRIGVAPDGDNFALTMVADGLGGYSAGKFASNLAIEEIKKWWDKRIYNLIQQEQPIKKISDELNAVFRQINKLLVDIGKEKKIKIGTTLSLLFLYNGNFLIQHIGDSRIYQLDLPLDLNHFRIKQLTEDQTWVSLLYKQGQISSEEIRYHPKRNILLQCLGINNELNIYQLQGKYNYNHLFILSSDGFYSQFTDKEIERFLFKLAAGKKKLQSVSERLVEFAVNSGAEDNISVVLIRQLPLQISKWKKLLRMFY